MSKATFQNEAAANQAAVIIHVGIDARGIPKVDKKVVEVNVDQRIVWVGPEKMSIIFPQASPFSSKALSTNNAVITELIPSQTFGDSKSLSFKYDVEVEGKVLDPVIIIKKPE